MAADPGEVPEDIPAEIRNTAEGMMTISGTPADTMMKKRETADGPIIMRKMTVRPGEAAR